MSNQILKLSLTVSDIPKDKINNHSNGKKYLNLVASEMQQADNYGNTHTVYIEQSKEEREAKATKVYVGKGKVITFGGQQQAPQQQQGGTTHSGTWQQSDAQHPANQNNWTPSPENADDLPF